MKMQNCHEMGQQALVIKKSRRASCCLHTPRNGSPLASDGGRTGGTPPPGARPSPQNTWITRTPTGRGGLPQDRESPSEDAAWHRRFWSVLDSSELALGIQSAYPGWIPGSVSHTLQPDDFGKSLTLDHSQFSHLQNGDNINSHLNNLRMFFVRLNGIICVTHLGQCRYIGTRQQILPRSPFPPNPLPPFFGIQPLQGPHLVLMPCLGLGQ